MITAIIAFFQAIPAITGGITAFSQAYFDAKVKLVSVRVGGDVEVAKQIVSGVVTEGQTRVDWLKTVSQSKFLMALVGGFAIPWIAYEWKVVLWDNMLHFTIYGVYGFTPPIKGLVAEWAGWILGGIFGTGGAMAAGQMFFNRKERS